MNSVLLGDIPFHNDGKKRTKLAGTISNRVNINSDNIFS